MTTTKKTISHQPKRKTPMSQYGDECDLLDTWARLRADDLAKKWSDAVYGVIQGSPWAFEVNVRLDDACNGHARSERLAYMRGEPIPDEHAALAELLAWVRSEDKISGGFETLPRLPHRTDIDERALNQFEQAVRLEDACDALPF
jgi:hypothetical protein